MRLRNTLAVGILAVLISACSSQSATSPVLPNQDPVTDPNVSGAPSAMSDNGSASAQTAPQDASNAIQADTISQTTTSVPRHVLTAEYLAGYYGTKRVSAAQAAPYLNWAQTTPQDSGPIHAAGIKTNFYTNPNRTKVGDPLRNLVNSTAYAKTCSNLNTTYVYKTTTQNIMAIGSTSLKSGYNSYVNSRLSGYHIDAVFEDNKYALSVYGESIRPGMPCAYSDTTWVTQAKELTQAIKYPTIFNGLSGTNGHDVSKGVQLMTSPSIIGGTWEGCYATYTTIPEITDWRWQATENTEIQVQAKDKLFFCLERNGLAASSAYAARLYTLGSFLLAYNPSYAVLWEEFATPDGLPIMPESQFVPLDPVRAQPTAISQLKSSYGPYYRQYNRCYYKGALVGACAIVVNGDLASERFPLSGYTHTMLLRGNGVLDGGTVSFTGTKPAYDDAVRFSGDRN